jgi:hypothetical protein
MRGAFVALDEGKLVPYATAAFEAYWGDDRDISQEDVLADIAAKAGLERQRFFAASRPTPASAAARQHRRADRARRLRQPDDVRGRVDVLRQRSPAAGARGAGGRMSATTIRDSGPRRRPISCATAAPSRR